MTKQRILFVCIHNSARSQMAEAFINAYAGDVFIAESAGLEPGKLNSYVVKAMKTENIDISKNKTNSVKEFYEQGKTYDYVIAVCDKKAAEKCPIFPEVKKLLHWPFDDPSSFKGNEEEKINFAIKIKNDIKKQIIKFIDEHKNNR